MKRKIVAADMKKIYTAISADTGWNELESFSEKWDKKYPYISKSWKYN